MRMRATAVACAGVALAWSAALLPVAPAAHAATPRSDPADYVDVTRVLVNRLGGVSVEGTMSCAASAALVRAGSVQGDDLSTEQPDLQPISLLAGDSIVLLANPDRYTVSQPIGRRTMIQATHEPSRMNPCYTEVTALPDFAVECPVGQACAWRTDRYGWSYSRLGPLFDYSPGGTFKAGQISVDGHSTDLAVIVLHSGGSTSRYMVEGGFFENYSPVIRAVLVR